MTIPLQVESRPFVRGLDPPICDCPPKGQLRVGYVWRNAAEFVPITEPVRRSARSVIGAALRRTGLRK